MVVALCVVGSGVAVAHQPVVLMDTDTTAAKGPLLVDGTVSFAIRASFTKAGQKKAFRAQFKDGDALELQYLIVDKKPENGLKSTQLPTLAVTGPGGFKLTMKLNERTKFFEPYGKTNYLYLGRYSGMAKAGVYSFVITSRAKSAITVAVGDREVPGEVVRGAATSVTPTPVATPTPSSTPTVVVTPTPTPSGNFCDGTGVSFSICQYTPANPTPTITPTITLTKTVDVQGQATFVMLDEMFNCVNVKVLVDCATGTEYYTSDNLIYLGTPIVTGITMSVLMNNTLMCLTYVGNSNTISSNCIIDDIVAISNSCGTCNVFPSPTPTNTSEPTPTPTMTPTGSNTLLTPTPTPTNTKTPTQTPTPTPHWVYVYESCGPIGQQLINTQVIQTVKVIPNTVINPPTFKESLLNNKSKKVSNGVTLGKGLGFNF